MRRNFVKQLTRRLRGHWRRTALGQHGLAIVADTKNGLLAVQAGDFNVSRSLLLQGEYDWPQINWLIPLLNASRKSQPALGLMEHAEYQSSEIILSPNDLILLFTDGLIEVQNPKNELYTQQLLLAAVQRRLQLRSPQIFDEMLAEVREFSGDAEFTDDVCLVGMDLTVTASITA